MSKEKNSIKVFDIVLIVFLTATAIISLNKIFNSRLEYTTTEIGDGTILMKETIPEYSYLVNGGDFPAYHHSPSEFSLYVRFKNGVGWIKVKQELYNKVRIGETLQTVYDYNHMTGYIRLRSVKKK